MQLDPLHAYRDIVVWACLCLDWRMMGFWAHCFGSSCLCFPRTHLFAMSIISETPQGLWWVQVVFFSNRRLFFRKPDEHLHPIPIRPLTAEPRLIFLIQEGKTEDQNTIDRKNLMTYESTNISQLRNEQFRCSFRLFVRQPPRIHKIKRVVQF